MQPHILTVPDDADYRQLVRLAESIGLLVGPDGLVSKSENLVSAHVIRPVLTEAERQHHLDVITRGGSGTSIPDPLAWQREVRQDRLLPGRD